MSAEFVIGSTVKIVSMPAYLKTAEPMPMLRPAQLVSLGETCVVLDQLPGNFWAVKCQCGNFLIDSQHLEVYTP